MFEFSFSFSDRRRGVVKMETASFLIDPLAKFKLKTPVTSEVTYANSDEYSIRYYVT